MYSYFPSIAVISNIVLLILWGSMLVENGSLPSTGSDDFLLAYVMVIAPLMSLLVIFKPATTLLGTYFRRKALEEEQKISKLKSDGQR